jgi:EmrB/QacA subfamily drug resistance transporter
MDAPVPATAELDRVVADGLPHFTHREILRVLSGILLCIFLAAIDQTVVIPAVPAIAADLHGFGHLSWIVAAYLLTSTAATPIYGKLSDIYGRRALLLPAIVGFVIGSMLCGASLNLWELIAARALQGIGGGGLMAMAQASIADVVAPRERGKYQGYMASAWGIASIAGPVLGGWITDQFSWRWIFWINLPIGIVAFMLCSRGLRTLPVPRRRTRIDYVGAAMIAVWTAMVLLLMSWGGTTYPWASAPIGGLAACAAALLAALVWQERRATEPLLPPRLFTNSVFVRGVSIAAMASAGTFGAIFLLPLFFQLLRGVSAEAAGVLIVPYLAFNVLGAYSSGQIARRLGRGRIILLGGLATGAAGYVLLANVGARTPEALIVVAMAVVGYGIGTCMPTSLVVVQNSAERRDVGAATGSLLFLRSMGGALGTTLAGSLLAGRFAAGMAAHGGAVVDLASLRGHRAAALALDPALRDAARAALAGGFHVGFWAMAGLLAAAFAICLGLRDLALKSSG